MCEGWHFSHILKTHVLVDIITAIPVRALVPGGGASTCCMAMNMLTSLSSWKNTLTHMESRIYHIPHTDLVSCDGWLNWVINGRRGRQCESRPVVGSVVFQCMNNIPKHDYKAVFSKKIVRLKMCVDTNGGYFEGLS